MEPGSHKESHSIHLNNKDSSILARTIEYNNLIKNMENKFRNLSIQNQSRRSKSLAQSQSTKQRAHFRNYNQKENIEDQNYSSIAQTAQRASNTAHARLKAEFQETLKATIMGKNLTKNHSIGLSKTRPRQSMGSSHLCTTTAKTSNLRHSLDGRNRYCKAELSTGLYGILTPLITQTMFDYLEEFKTSFRVEIKAMVKQLVSTSVEEMFERLKAVEPRNFQDFELQRLAERVDSGQDMMTQQVESLTKDMVELAKHYSSLKGDIDSLRDIAKQQAQQRLSDEFIRNINLKVPSGPPGEDFNDHSEQLPQMEVDYRQNFIHYQNPSLEQTEDTTDNEEIKRELNHHKTYTPPAYADLERRSKEASKNFEFEKVEKKEKSKGKGSGKRGVRRSADVTKKLKSIKRVVRKGIKRIEKKIKKSMDKKTKGSKKRRSKSGGRNLMEPLNQSAVVSVSFIEKTEIKGGKRQRPMRLCEKHRGEREVRKRKVVEVRHGNLGKGVSKGSERQTRNRSRKRSRKRHSSRQG